jgi:Zn-dependent protease with chaperone function
MPSEEFRRNVRKVVFAFILFGLLYIILLIGAIAVTALFAFIGAGVISAMPNTVGFAFGIGMIIAGIMIVYFFIKVLFTKSKHDISDYTEIFEKDHPELFGFIRNISREAGTHFPKHIYLSPEVNAAVFYDSTFWSMFLPVKKNLVVGLGMVNMTNLSELKAVLAHEFGHFSQKSMRAGSYVYQTNRVVYNMLFENQGYHKAINRVGRANWVLYVCMKITINIVWSIQWIMKRAYYFVNKVYMGLSREMEFHADAMAAKLSGSNNTINALKRIDLADSCYNSVIESYNLLLGKNFKGDNVYSQQRIVGIFMAKDHGMKLSNGIPIASESSKYFKSFRRINVANQWASHPTTKQRIKALEQIPVEGIVFDESSWSLFEDPKKLQEAVTDGLYRNIKFSGAITNMDDNIFTNYYTAQQNKYELPSFFNGYYSGRYIEEFDMKSVPLTDEAISEPSLFFKDHEDDFQKIAALKEDIGLLEQVVDKKNDIRTFDFEGVRHERGNAEAIKTELGRECKELEEGIRKNDALIFAYYCLRSSNNSIGVDLRKYYSDYFMFLKLFEENSAICNEMWEKMKPFYNERITAETAARLNYELEEGTLSLKERMVATHNTLIRTSYYTDEQIPDNIADLKNKSLIFFKDKKVQSDNLNFLRNYIERFFSWSADMLFKSYKIMLEKQAEIAAKDEQTQV